MISDGQEGDGKIEALVSWIVDGDEEPADKHAQDDGAEEVFQRERGE